MEALNQLTQTLKMMVEAHTRLLHVAKEKTTILVDGNIQGLQSLIYKESSCTDEIQKLEHQRIQLVQIYMQQKGQIGYNFTLEEVLEVESDDVLKAQLHLFAKQLRALVQEITYLNDRNQQLIRTSLSYVQYALGMLMPKEQAVGYGPRSKKRYTSLLDAKI